MKGTLRIRNLRTPALQHPLTPQALKRFPAREQLLPAPALTTAVATAVAPALVPARITAVATAVVPALVPAQMTAVATAVVPAPVPAQMTAVTVSVVIAAVAGNVEALSAGTLGPFPAEEVLFGCHQSCYHDSYESPKMDE